MNAQIYLSKNIFICIKHVHLTVNNIHYLSDHNTMSKKILLLSMLSITGLGCMSHNIVIPSYSSSVQNESVNAQNNSNDDTLATGTYILMWFDPNIKDVNQQIKTEFHNSLNKAFIKGKAYINDKPEHYGTFAFIFANGQVFSINQEDNIENPSDKLKAGYIGYYENGNRSKPILEVVNDQVMARQIAKDKVDKKEREEMFYLIDGKLHMVDNNTVDIINHAQLQESLRNMVANKLGITKKELIEEIDLTDAEEILSKTLSKEEEEKIKKEQEDEMNKVEDDLLSGW